VKKILLMMLFIAMSLTGIFGMEVRRMTAGQSAVDFNLKDTSGANVTLSEFRGSPVILFFWTTWCPHCRKELERIDTMSQQFQKEGIKVLPLDIGESPVKVMNFLKSRNLNLTVALDVASTVARDYNIRGVPTYIFISKTGAIISEEHTLPSDYRELLQ
jgi:peroxiredoxin